MVLSSAKYKRHDNEPVGDHSEERHTLAELAPSANSSIIISGNNGRPRRRDSLVSFEEDLSTTASDHLCTANVGDSGGHVRYHMSPPSFWSRRTQMERFLLVFCTVLVFSTFVLLLIVSYNTSPDPDAEARKIHVTSAAHQQVCLSPECVKVAATILSDMDMTVDPCKDFYQFSCGGWQKMNPIPDGHSSWSMFEKMWETNQLVMKNALEEKPSKTEDNTVPTGSLNEAELKAKRLFDSCMDNDEIIEKLGGKPVIDLIVKYFGGWPLMLEPTSIAKAKSMNLTTFRNMLMTLHNELQSQGFFAWSVGENDRNSTLHVIQIDQGGLSLPTRDFYMRDNNSAIVEGFKKTIYNIAVLLIRDWKPKNESVIPESDEVEIKKQIDDLIQFETRIANLTTPLSKRREETPSFNNFTLKDLEELSSFLDWTEYFNRGFAKVNRTLDSSESVVVYASRFLSNISDLVHEYLSTDQGRITLYNYIVWQTIRPLRSALSSDYRNADSDLNKAMLGKDGRQDRWRFCVSDTDSVLGFASGALFVKAAFHGESKPSAQKMIDNIKAAFKKRLTDLTWMDHATQQAAIKKAIAISDMIGFPEFILEKNQLEEKYSDLIIRSDDYFGNFQRARNYSFIENMKKLDEPVNRTRWSMTPPTVNAYYTPTKNQIVFPAGILQSPFFNLDYPKSLNYGAMGVVMGHELSHAFDDQGREYDELGNMRQWWNNITLNTFKNRTACMENQYSAYHFKAQNLSGVQTLGENIADNGGLKASYYAYRQWLKMQTFDEEPPLPGLNMTHNQLFFLSFAQVWCSSSTPQANELQILEDSHSPPRFRVIGVLSNTKEFSDVFKCPIGSPMNPKAKCEVW